jgi:hypothetical protein
MQSGGAGARRCSGGTKCFMLSIKLVLTFHLYIIACGLAILNGITGVDFGIDVFTNIIRQGFIHLLVGAAIVTPQVLGLQLDTCIA